MASTRREYIFLNPAGQVVCFDIWNFKRDPRYISRIACTNDDYRRMIDVANTS